MYCKFGCGLKVVKDGRCNEAWSRCPVLRFQNSQMMKEKWRNGKTSSYSSFSQETKDKMAWSRGLTKENDARIKNIAEKLKGKSRLSDEERVRKLAYWRDCQFDLRGVIQFVLGYDLLLKFGMYHRIKNKNGVVRDHRISIEKGFLHGIPSKLISHPANCRFLTSLKNSQKSKASEINYEQLLLDIKVWEKLHPTKK